MQIMKTNGHWNFMSATIWKTPGFETNDLGYIREADQILSVLWAGYNQWEPKGSTEDIIINADIYSVNNFGGDWVSGKDSNGMDSMGLKNLLECMDRRQLKQLITLLRECYGADQ